MKKNSKFIIGLCLAIGLALVCTAASLFDNSLMDSRVQIADHAVLYFDSGIAHPLVDNDIIVDTKGTLSDKNIIVMLTPGVHTINGMIADFAFGQNTITSTTSGFMEITHDFATGHHYFIQVVKNGNTVSLQIIDETNPVSAWNDEAAQKRAEKRISEAKSYVNKASYPKKTSLSVSNSELWNTARIAAETPFEGIWQGQEKNTGYYRFKGNTYYYSFTGDFTKVAISDHEGVFEYTDNTITLTTLRDVYMGMRVTTGLVNCKERKATYTYNMGNGSFVLSSKNKPVGTFAKK